ncbi:MAG: acylneuraminate cytidylyltransferase family protein [bacterium]|nr:acylneuraminate cytidylyltransferase family protein [bacterium]
MIQKYNVLAIIPARGGSKRIFGKNLKVLAGKPLIQYSIDEAKKSKYIDRLVTSTDDQKIAEVAKRLGSEVPFIRPEDISGDTITDFPVFAHALEWYEKEEGYIPDIIVQLRPTSPLRIVEEIDAAIELLVQNPEADSVRTVAEPEQSPYKMYKVSESGILEPLLAIDGVAESFNMPGLSLPKTYKHVGYVDVMWRRTIVEKKQMTGHQIIPLILEKAYSGINKPEDWDYYEYLLTHKK